MIEKLLERYSIKSADEHFQALREVMQEVVLAGLYRGGFFEKAAFYGGTALRIFHGLERFSEDLDFSLLSPDPQFSLTPYFAAIHKEFDALGIAVHVEAKEKHHKAAIKSAFLKSDTSVHELQVDGLALFSRRPIKIKFELDTQPPGGFTTEEKLLLQPFSFYVKCYCPGDLFAGKLHALLYRGWKNRVKGRDWYDFEWYIRQGHSVHLLHFLQRAQQSGALVDHTHIGIDEVRGLLIQRIESINFEQAKQDVFPFVQDLGSLRIWSREYFLQLVEQLHSERN